MRHSDNRGRHSLIGIFSVIGSVALGAALLTGCPQQGNKAASKGAPTGPVPVLAGEVVRKTVPVQIQVIGAVQANQSIAVRSQVTGTLQKIHFREGDDVQKGALLFEIDARPFEAAVEQARAQLARDQALADNAQVEAQRTEKLFAQGAATQEQAQNTRAAADAARATVRADQAALKNAETQLSYCTVRAPISGRTGQLLVHQGNLISANNTVVVQVNQIEPVFVTFAVPQQNLPAIQARMAAKNPLTAYAEVPGGAKGIPGAVTFLDNTVDPATGTITLKATIPNLDRSLWPGQFVNVTLVLSEQADAVVVPSQAVQVGQQGNFVYIVTADRKAELRPITAGRTLNGETVVERGLDGGETVVTDGQLRLVPGAQVEIRTSLTPAAAPTAEKGPAK